MDVRISFMGVIAAVTGTKELLVSIEGKPTLRTLIDDLERRYGPDFGARVYRTSTPPRRLQMCTRIFVNQQLMDERALDESLPSATGADPSEVLVYLLPASCGG